MIPAIVHQTWKTADVPERFRAAASSWRRLHPAWEYRFWTDADIDRFVRERFPRLLPLFAAYADAIQRVDAFRYLVLYDQGGLYADLDIECLRPFDDLRRHQVVLPVTAPVGLSNDLMLAQPGHPLFLAAIEALPLSFRRWQHPWIPRHLRVLAGTGSLHLTRVYRQSARGDDVVLLSPGEYSSQDRRVARVYHLPGNTWAGWDTRLLSGAYQVVRRFRSRR
ncbi:MAG TPA: glycosyltransferase [Longimicrobiales bacterium]